MNMVNKMHTRFIVGSYMRQEPIDEKQLRKMLNAYSITTAISNYNLMIQLSDELVTDDDSYVINGVTYTKNGLNEYNKLLYSVDVMTDDTIIIKHNKSGYRLKINLNSEKPVWYDYVSDEFERVITMYLKQKPMNFDDLKDFANFSEFCDSLYYNNNYIFILSDFNENITVLDNAKVNMPYKYSGENLSQNDTTYSIDNETYKISDLQKYHEGLYEKINMIESKDGNGRTTKRYIIKHNDSGRYLENLSGYSVSKSQRKVWYEVVPKEKQVYKLIGEPKHKDDKILRSFLKQEKLSFSDIQELLNRYRVFSCVYSGGSFIHDEIKSDLRYKDITLSNFDYFEVDGFYIIDGVQYDFDSLAEYTKRMFIVHDSYERDYEQVDTDYCLIEHVDTGRYLKFESGADSYSGFSFEDSVWFEVKKELVTEVQYEVV